MTSHRDTTPTTFTVNLPVRYHANLESDFESWAASCGMTPRRLRSATKRAIQTRRHEAYIEGDWHRAQGRRPNVYTLPLDSIEVYYTIEHEAVIIRGYGWDVPGDPDESDGGGYYCDFEWSQP